MTFFSLTIYYLVVCYLISKYTQKFYTVFLLLIFSLISSWSKSILRMMSTVLKLLRYDLWLRTWYIWGNIPWELEKSVWSLLDEEVYKCQLHPVERQCCSVQLYPYWHSACWICRLFIKGYWRLLYSSEFVYRFLQFYLFLLHIFWCSVVRYIHIKDSYVFLQNWPLYHVMPVFIPDNSPCREVCFVWN